MYHYCLCWLQRGCLRTRGTWLGGYCALECHHLVWFTHCWDLYMYFLYTFSNWLQVFILIAWNHHASCLTSSCFLLTPMAPPNFNNLPFWHWFQHQSKLSYAWVWSLLVYMQCARSVFMPFDIFIFFDANSYSTLICEAFFLVYLPLWHQWKGHVFMQILKFLPLNLCCTISFIKYYFLLTFKVTPLLRTSLEFPMQLRLEEIWGLKWDL